MSEAKGTAPREFSVHGATLNWCDAFRPDFRNESTILISGVIAPDIETVNGGLGGDTFSRRGGAPKRGEVGAPTRGDCEEPVERLRG